MELSSEVEGAGFLPCACAVRGRTCSHGQCAHPPQHQASPPASRGLGCCRGDTQGPAHPVGTRKRGLGACSWVTSSVAWSPLSLSGSACCGFRSITCSLRSCSAPSKEAVCDPSAVTAMDTRSGKGGQQGWEMPKPFHPVAEGGLEVCSTKIQILAFRDTPTLSTHPKGDRPSDQRNHKLFGTLSSTAHEAGLDLLSTLTFL